MPHRVAQVNELLKSELAQLINREIELLNGLITVTGVSCSPDLRYAKIFVSVLPENNTGSALKALRKQAGSFSKILKKRLNLKYIPKFNFSLDTGEIEQAKVEKILKDCR